jgi:hypothetical protein
MKIENEEYQAYIEQRENLNKSEYSVSEKYDHWLLTLSSGSLAISLTFIKNIVPNPDKNTILFLIVSWLLLIISILTSLYSLLTSQAAIRRARDILDESYYQDNESSQNQNIDKPENPSARTTNVLNWISMFAFTVGIIFLCTFSIINMYKGSIENGKEKIVTNQNTQESFKEKGIRTTNRSKTTKEEGSRKR